MPNLTTLGFPSLARIAKNRAGGPGNGMLPIKGRNKLLFKALARYEPSF